METPGLREWRRTSEPGGPSQPGPTLSVVFSFRNEEANIPELLKRLRRTLRAELELGRIGGWELIFVDDDSQDGSLELLKQLDEGHGDIRILTMSRRFGVSPCALAGIEHSSGDLVIYMDCDLQDPPELIPELIRAWREGDGVEVVHTVRLSRRGESRIKLLITAIGYRILRRVADIDLPIQAGDFKLLTRRAADHLVRLKEERPYLRGLVCWIGFRQATVKYHREKRFSGKTKFPVISRSVIRNFTDSALISFSDAPLRMAGTLGCLLSLCALGGAVAAAVLKLKGFDVAVIWVLLIAVIFLSGIQLFSIGILGLYVGAVHLQSRQRPGYIVARTYGFEAPLRDPPPRRSGRHDESAVGSAAVDVADGGTEAGQ